jgi:hypothetical protein
MLLVISHIFQCTPCIPSSRMLQLDSILLLTTQLTLSVTLITIVSTSGERPLWRPDIETDWPTDRLTIGRNTTSASISASASAYLNPSALRAVRGDGKGTQCPEL